LYTQYIDFILPHKQEKKNMAQNTEHKTYTDTKKRKKNTRNYKSGYT